MPTIQQLVGTRVRELRKARDWTLEDLAEKAKKHYTYIGGLERGDRNVTLEVLQAVATALDVPLKELFSLEPHPLEAKLNASANDILSAIQSQGSKVHYLQKSEPTLEDVFVSMVGRGLE